MKSLNEFLSSQNNVIVLDEGPNSTYTHLDLSIDNRRLTPEICSNSDSLGSYINDILSRDNAQLAYGGYDEERAIYRRSDIFNNNESEERNIHIGLDLWAPANTAVYAALDGVVHSFAYNQGKGNYGPAIILKHQIENQEFYTLYGHLNLDCLTNLKVGQIVEKRSQIGKLGDESVNGDYPAHLHFQIINDIENNHGDYPGVCTKSEREFYLNNCPDPNLLLKINL